MPNVRDDCLDAVFDFMLNYDWGNEEIFDGFSDQISRIKYYAIVLPIRL